MQMQTLHCVSVNRLKLCKSLICCAKISLSAVTIATLGGFQGETFDRAGSVAAELADGALLEHVASLEAFRLRLQDFERDQVASRGIWSRVGYGVEGGVRNGSSEAGAKEHGCCGEIADDEGSTHFGVCVGMSFDALRMRMFVLWDWLLCGEGFGTVVDDEKRMRGL